MGYVRIMWVGANLLALIPLAPLLRSKDLRLGRLHAAIAFTSFRAGMPGISMPGGTTLSFPFKSFSLYARSD
ncbi:hypothetical protein, partial [Bifidobacterium longum]|uniref:hypothetical protein n=1 Tax=Bifidobacterium longum TaxID=216816 RepID=UPI001A9549BA